MSVVLLLAALAALFTLYRARSLGRFPPPTPPARHAPRPPAPTPRLAAALAVRLQPDGSLAPTRDVDHRPIEVWLVAAASLFFGAASCAFLAALVADRSSPAPSDPAIPLDALSAIRRTGLTLLLTYAMAIPLALAILRFLLWSPARSTDDLHLAPLPLTRGLLPGLFWSLLIFPIVMAVSLGASLLVQLLTTTPPPAVAHSTLRQIVDASANPWAWAVIAGTTLAAPLVEEILYRGIVQSAILRATSRPWVAIAVTSVLFALIHWEMATDAPSRSIMLPTLGVLSVLLGIAYERTRSLIVPVTIHAVFNAANILLATQT